MLLGGNLYSLSSIVSILALIQSRSHPLAGLYRINKRTDLRYRSLVLEEAYGLRPWS